MPSRLVRIEADALRQLTRLLGEAGAGVARIAEVVDAVKRFSHLDEAPVQDVDVHDGLEAALTILHGRIPPGVGIVCEYDPDLPAVEGFPGDLNSVWANLLDNALDAVGQDGVITIRTRTRDHGVEVEVENTGAVVPAAVVERAFDPFFTTKPVGQGAGLGLAMADNVIVRRHRGRIDLHSEPGRTVAVVLLPRRLQRPGESVEASATVPRADSNRA